MERINQLILLILMSISFFHVDVYAQEKKEKKWSILPVPTIGYSPETRGYIGGVALISLQLGQEETNRLSNFDVELNYTQNQQLILSSEWELNWGDGNWISNGLVSYRHFPDLYWGVGSNTVEADEESYESNIFEIDINLQRQVYHNLYIGGSVYFRDESDISSSTEDGTLNQHLVSGSYGSKVLGGGIITTYDSRNHLLNTTKGMLISASGKLLNYKGVNEVSTKNYLHYALDVRKFVALDSSNLHLIAFQFYGKWNTADVGFNNYNKIGHESYFRGYYHGRFRDTGLMTMQAEYRFKIYKRFGGVAFAGGGTVYNTTLDFSSIKPSYGGGLRFLIDRENNTNLRMDYAMGTEGGAFYIGFGEAF